MKELRLRNGLTTKQMGKALGYQGKPASLETIIKRFESGRRPIPKPVRLLVAMYDAYGIPSDWYKGV